MLGERGHSMDFSEFLERLEPREATADVVYSDDSANGDGDEAEARPEPQTEESAGTRAERQAAEITKQPVPSESNCPYCGSEPTADSRRRHNLSAMGYLHDDLKLDCGSEDCGRSWVCGRPVGEYDGGEDLFCASCESRWMRVHRVEHVGGESPHYKLHLKCPNPECYHFKQVSRTPDDSGIALVGYPDITGSTEGAEAYGYPDE